MPRLRLKRPAAHCSARLIAAACLVLGTGSAWAQVTPPFGADPLAPNAQTDPRNPPSFQRSNRAPYSQAPGTAVFAPAAGAGRTGFNSTNTRRTAPQSSARAGAANAQAIAPGLPQPATVSPYQRPAGATALAQAPGMPPVELGPIRKPPPKRKAHVEPDDPYAQLGFHAGSFMVYPAIELIGGYDTNPGRSPAGQGARLYTVAPELRAQSDWSRHELKADLRGSYTGYSPDETPTLSRPYVNGKVDGRVDITRATRVDLSGRVLVSTDNPGSPNLQAGLSKLPVYTTVGGSAGLGHRFNRFDVSLKGDIERTAYQDSQLTNGTTASNEDRNYNQYGGRLRGAYELSPGITPFVEVGIDQRKHDLETDVAGYRRNSDGWTGNVGTTFELTRQLTGEASIGYVERTYDDPRLEKLSGLIGNASLIWTADALTSVKLTGASSVGESSVPGVSGTLYRDMGLQVDHSFRRWLIGTAKLGFGFDDYVGLDRKDNRYSAGLGMTYKVDRSIQFKGEFRQEWLRSNVTGVDYTASVFLLGLRLQQ